MAFNRNLFGLISVGLQAARCSPEKWTTLGRIWGLPRKWQVTILYILMDILLISDSIGPARVQGEECESKGSRKDRKAAVNSAF